jgi:hypothetical protein
MLNSTFTGTEQFYDCEICNEPISNPLCPVCLTTEIEAWLTLYPSLRQDLIPRLEKKFKHSIKDAVQCIKCNNQSSVCPLCFTKTVLNELRAIRVNKIILREFLQFFNFDFEHVVYTKDAEELGVI